MGKLIRLDKFLADMGKGTRSEVKSYIKKGYVTVNDNPAKSSDLKIDVESDVVKWNGEKLSFEEFRYYMLNKPAGVVSATTDNRDKTVIELITEDKPRDLFPVGRLDKDTEGLLIITNDGKLSNSLLSPKKHVDKTYYAHIVMKRQTEKLEIESDVENSNEKSKIDSYCGEIHINAITNSGEVYGEKNFGNIVTDDMILCFEKGVDIGDEELTAPAKLVVLFQDEHKSEIEITITEGRYHQIKRMFEAFGREVSYLKRLSMGAVKLDEKLALGEYRRLTAEELESLNNR